MSQNKEFVENVLALIQKEYGEGIMIDAENFIQKKKLIIPISPALDGPTGGGIPEGTWTLITGLPKIGKTTLGLHILRNAQKLGKHVYVINVEGRIKEMNLVSAGIDMKHATIIESTQDKIMTQQDYLNAIELIIRNHPGCVIFIDSYSALCPEKEANEGVGTFTRGGNAALLAQFFRQMANTVPVMNTIVIGVAHLMANTSGMGAAIQEKGGMAMAYQGDVKFRAKNREFWEDKEKNKIGQKVTWVVEYNALGAPPHQETISYIRYGSGIDEITESLEIGIDLGIIGEKGSYLTLDYMKDFLPLLDETTWGDEAKKKVRANGKENMYNLLIRNPIYFERLKSVLKQMSGG